MDQGASAIEPLTVIASGTAGSEAEDVALAAAGDHRAFERLYRAHLGRIYSLALRMAGPAWADDLTQEVFIRAWDRLKGFKGRSSFGTWLHRLAVNLILTRREALRKRAQRQAPDIAVLERTPARTKRPGLRLDLEGAIQQLPDGARTVFVLYEVEGLSHREIGRLTGVSTGTSKSQLHRARMLLREYLLQEKTP